MKSNVEFYIERSAILVASPNVQDYSTVHTSSHIALFKADDNVENISFVGGGTIDGGG